MAGIDWFRWHHGSVMDPKFKLVARRAGASVPDVIAVWAYLLEQASGAADRGAFGDIDAESLDCAFNFPDTETRTADILAAMEERKLISDGRIVAWDKRQPKREREAQEAPGASTGRVARHRQQQPLLPTSSEEAEAHGAYGGYTDDAVRLPDSTRDNQAPPETTSNDQKRARGEESREEEIQGKEVVGGCAQAIASGSAPPPPASKSLDPEGRSQAMPADYAAFIASNRGDLDPAMVWANFCDHYPANRRDAARWRKWVRRENAAPLRRDAPPQAATVPSRPGPDHELLRVEADRKRAVPPPPEIKARMQELRSQRHQQPVTQEAT